MIKKKEPSEDGKKQDNLKAEQEQIMIKAMNVVLSYNSGKIIDRSMKSILSHESSSILFPQNFLQGLNHDTILQQNEKYVTLRQYPNMFKSILQWVLIAIVHF